MSNIICPFCGEEDFDLIGLKHHLQNHCEEYAATIGVSATPDYKPEETEEASDDSEDTP